MLPSAPRRSVRVRCLSCYEVRSWDGDEASVRQQFTRFMRLHEMMRGCRVRIEQDIIYTKEQWTQEDY